MEYMQSFIEFSRRHMQANKLDVVWTDRLTIETIHTVH